MDFQTRLNIYLSQDYDTVMASFEPTVGGTWLPAPVPSERPARRLRNAIAPLAEHAIWSQRTNEVLAKLGLGFLTGYVWGRAALLGEPPPEVLAAAFPVFEPRLLGAIYEEARKQCGRAGFLEAMEQATIEGLLEILGDVDVAKVVTVLRRGLEAADGCGRPLFCGLRALGWPCHPLGQLWRACDLLPEHRGDSHTAVWLAAGLGPVSINLLTELWLGMPPGRYTAVRRGWPEEAISVAMAHLEARGLVAEGAITTTGQSLRDDIEECTDALEQPIFDVIADDFEAVVASLDAWSGACVEAGAFPPHSFKTGAGAR